ncbi:SMP-30/gluconolactonase/LRE family protein [Cerasicoccus fimbriatus]|uniref:SMP-30/gluconolactonase/LRE family protein n=1 Tax=Cerasicoccus fimbriatus TaxID=3014554 RepID=UPI0022B3291B|nr:SMP-30/gluconolactonase/LRE family protein [Cerasicoccus sp. TK19100]
MEIYTPQPVTNHVAQLGEGPFWHDGMLHYVDIDNKKLRRIEGDESVLIHEFPTPIGVAAPARNGGFICGLENGIHHLSEDGELSLIVDPEAGSDANRFNDGKCDPVGRFVAGTISYARDPVGASLYSLSASGDHCEKILGEVCNSNGLAWTRDGHTLYYINTPSRQIWKFDYDLNTGHLSNKQVVIEIPPEDGKPDGMCIDQDDNLWIGHWAGWQIAHYDPRTGEKIGKVQMPAANCTSCCFGGKDYDKLYITTSINGLSDEDRADQPHAGKVFVADVKAKGFPTKAWG